MIDLKSWKIFGTPDLNPTIKREYAAVFMGDELKLDERSEWMTKYAALVGEKTIPVKFDISKSTLTLNDVDAFHVNDLSSMPKLDGDLLLDATTLSLPELLYLMSWANAEKKPFDVIYVEPNAYNGTKYPIGSHNPSLILSQDGPGLQLLPKYVIPFQRSHLIISLGYEGHRFGGLIKSDEIEPAEITGVLGIPPFVLGWENTSYTKNIEIMSETLRSSIEVDYQVTAANDPKQNYELCQKILTGHKPNFNNRGNVIVAPVGTKPVALGMIWFAINNQNIGVLYDFIEKKSKRTKGLGDVHLWSFHQLAS